MQNYQKQKFSKWAALVPKVLVDNVASFCAYPEPPSAHLKKQIQILETNEQDFKEIIKMREDDLFKSKEN